MAITSIQDSLPSLCVCRSNVKGVFLTALAYAVAQSLIFFLYSAGYVFGAFLVVEGRNNYDEIFRLVCR